MKHNETMLMNYKKTENLGALVRFKFLH